jgi:single-strand DNA-binding protein
MASLNRVFLIGNLTKDPELRYTPQGTAVANLRLAVNRRWKDKSGEQKEEVCFLTVVAWDKQAEVCNQYLRKGSPLFVEGRIQSRSWQDNSGAKRNVVEIRAERVQFLGQPGAGGAGKNNVPQEEAGDIPLPHTGPAAQDDVSWMEGDEKSENE